MAVRPAEGSLLQMSEHLQWRPAHRVLSTEGAQRPAPMAAPAPGVCHPGSKSPGSLLGLGGPFESQHLGAGGERVGEAESHNPL